MEDDVLKSVDLLTLATSFVRCDRGFNGSGPEKLYNGMESISESPPQYWLMPPVNRRKTLDHEFSIHIPLIRNRHSMMLATYETAQAESNSQTEEWLKRAS